MRKYLPVCARHGHEKNLAFWWRNRAVPKSRSDVRELLDKEGVRTTQSLLLNNLGLSMTDSFWVCPADSQLRWQDVSFHLNARGRKEIDISTGEWSPNRNLTPIASTCDTLKTEFPCIWTKTRRRTSTRAELGSGIRLPVSDHALPHSMADAGKLSQKRKKAFGTHPEALL